MEVIGDILHLGILTAVGDAWMFFNKWQIMGNHHHGSSFVSKAEKKLDDLVGCLWVKISCWLIGEN